MPRRWEILHSEKRVRTVAEGEVTLKDMEEHFDALAMAMGARLSVCTSHFPSGPLTVVGRDEAVVLAFERFVNISPSKRPAAIFKTEKKARAWLATQSGA